MCGCFVLFAQEKLHIVLLLNCSANESRPSFVAHPIKGAKSVQGFTLADEMSRKTRGIQKFRHYLSDKRWKGNDPPWMAELKIMFT